MQILIFNVNPVLFGHVLNTHFVNDLQRAMLLGADVYETEEEMAALLASGKVPLGIGENAKLRNCIIDKNARIGKDVTICNTDVSTLCFPAKSFC